jgi:hypothetical protein
VSAEDLVPVLVSLFNKSETFRQTRRGIESENVVQSALENRAGAAFGRVEDIKRLFIGQKKFSTTEPPRYLRLPDIEEGGDRVTPLVYLDGELSDTKPFLSLQVALIVHSKVAGAVSKKFAMRFETPEGSESRHDYYHSQLCNQLRRGGVANSALDLGLDIDWFPISHPAWPVDAGSPSELLACLVFALYGKRVGSDIIREAGEISGRDIFSELLGNMRANFRSETSAGSPTKKFGRKAKRTKKK